MAWTAEVTGVTKVEGNVVAAARLEDKSTGEVILRDVVAEDLTPDSLSAFLQRIIEGLEKRDAAAALIVPGPIVLPRDATDQETKDKIIAAALADAFFVLLAVHNAFQTQVEKGIAKADDAAVIDAAVAMKTAFLPEYAEDPRFR